MSQKKLLLIDDDILYGKIMKTVAEKEGIDLDYCRDLRNLHLLTHLKPDVILLDYWLGHANGVMLATLDPFFKKDIPILLISENRLLKKSNRKNNWPANIKSFLAKSDGMNEILATAMRT